MRRKIITSSLLNRSLHWTQWLIGVDLWSSWWAETSPFSPHLSIIRCMVIPSIGPSIIPRSKTCASNLQIVEICLVHGHHVFFDCLGAKDVRIILPTVAEHPLKNLLVKTTPKENSKHGGCVSSLVRRIVHFLDFHGVIPSVRKMPLRFPSVTFQI